MPLFNEASHIYRPDEVDFMRRCFSHAAIILEESDHSYAETELSASIVLLYQGGLRDLHYIAELASRLAHRRRDGERPDHHPPVTGKILSEGNAIS